MFPGISVMIPTGAVLFLLGLASMSDSSSVTNNYCMAAVGAIYFGIGITILLTVF